tara:strand:- start:207 stop:620 length:414 start_codon:yes stop_codon:yes gene_type:complete
MDNLELVDNVLYTKFDDLYFDNECLDVARIPVTMNDLQKLTRCNKSDITQELINKFDAKFCSVCKFIMNISNFGYNKKVKCGLNSQCQDCRKDTMRTFTQNRRDKKYVVKEAINTIHITADKFQIEEVKGGLLITII